MSEIQKKNIAQFSHIRRQHLFNRINALHYHGSPLRVTLKHKNHDFSLHLKAQPEPVSSEQASAHWIVEDNFPDNFNSYQLQKITLSNSYSSYEFTPDSFHLEKWGVRFTIPECGLEIDFRKQLRYHCAEKNVRIALTQNAIVFSGTLLDYSVNGILVQLDKKENFSFSWLNEKRPVILNILSNEEPVYTAEVFLTPRALGRYLLFPDQEAAPRHVPRKFRSRRQQLIPSPDLVFDHPIVGKKIRLKIFDLSSLGFSVEENASSACLLPGLLLRSATISIAGNVNIQCMAQVIYVKPQDDHPDIVKVGLTILNIDINDHLKLISLVQQAQDSRAYISNQIDHSDLFDFFFETGFIYPNKYVELAKKKNEIINSYAALYEKGANISRHFVYQDTGKILGHFSSLRVYRKTWMNQHHAALRSRKAGLQVVRAISEYLNDSYKLNPANIQYIIGYYRAENKFPQKYFGEYVNNTGSTDITSLDCLSYINDARKFAHALTHLKEGWTLENARKSDLVEFRGYYHKISGGLLPQALDMEPESFNDQTLTETYTNNNLMRKRNIYALRFRDMPKALIDVQTSDFGLNLSEITNAITVYLIEPSSDFFDIVSCAIRRIALKYEKMSDPVMFYPHNYLIDCGFKADKEYLLWALDITLGSESYMAWMNRFCR